MLHKSPNEIFPDADDPLPRAPNDTSEANIRKALSGEAGAKPIVIALTPVRAEDAMRTANEAEQKELNSHTVLDTKMKGGRTGFLVICAGLCALGYFLFRGPAKQLKMGRHLTRMTNVFEEIERTRHTMYIGAGGGVDSLPPGRQRQANMVFEQGVSYLKTYPRHEVTRELVKNAVLAERMGKPFRVIAIGRLVEALTDMGVALEMDEFMKSYA
jgi:hypothetical protein